MFHLDSQSIIRLLKASSLGVLCLLMSAGVSRAEIATYNIQIDASTTQPIGTGFIAPVSGDHVLIIAEGALQPFPSSTRVENGWIGADGMTRLSRAGQPIADGMPYGALIGGTGIIPAFQFLGSHGGYKTQPADVGLEFKLALNMSDADLLISSGIVSITLVHIPAGDPDIVETILDSNSGSVVGTGIIADPGEQFMVLAYGAGNVVSTNSLSDGWFTPEGQIRFNRGGQPYPDGPFGGLYANLDGGTGFFIGEAGSWTGQGSDAGDELFYTLNMSATDAASMQGRILVRTIRIPDATSAVGEQDGGFESSVQSFPNPMTDDARIRFSLPSEESVRLRVYDTSGRWVRNLVDEAYSVGDHEVVWDGRDDDGESVTSGTYFYQMSTSSGSKTGSIVVTR